MKKSFVAALLAVAAVAAHADTVNNGSFESQIVADALSVSVSGYTGWTWNNAGSLFLQNPTASNSRQPLDGSNNYAVLWNGAQISQSFATQVGKTYTLTFDYDNVVNLAKLGITGQTTQTLANPAGAVLATKTVVFVATSANTTISFMAGLNNGANVGKMFLDNVTLTSAVPEPASSALFMAGLAAVGALSRRRRTQA
jgi:hypothetical protein